MRRLPVVIVLILAAAPALHAGSEVKARTAAASTASPYATSAALGVLQDGGTAADAAVAAAFALAVAHPQAGNLGGGGVLLFYEKSSGAVWMLDFRAIAPSTRESVGEMPVAAAPANDIGIPATVAGLDELHRRFGRLEWARLVQPSIHLAKEGIRIDEALHRDLTRARDEREISRHQATAAAFFVEDQPPRPGSVLRQPDLAKTLERIARNGAGELRTGQTAKRLLRTASTLGSVLSQRDLDRYRPSWLAPLRLDLGSDRIYVPAPPFASGLFFAETLAILDGYAESLPDITTAPGVHLLCEVARRGFLDVGRYVSEPRGRLRLEEILSSERARHWRESIDPRRASSSVILSAKTFQGEQTTHLSIVDPEGNAVALTTTLGEAFGSGAVVGGAGFFLNTRIGPQTDDGADRSSALSSELMMMPLIVVRDGSPWLIAGSRGGATIPTTLLQIFVSVARQGRSLGAAIAAPRFHHQGLPDLIFYEKEQVGVDFLQQLNDMGHPVRARAAIGEVYAILVQGEEMIAIADSRAGGAAGGF